MKYVLDSSVALKWVLAEVDSHKAVRLRNEYIAGQHELLAPDLFATEVANALVSAERQRRIQPGQAAIFLNDILIAAPTIYPTTPLLIRSMELAVATKRAVYDCIYLALAESEGCDFLTADDQFAHGLSSSFPFVVSLLSFP